MLLPGILLVLLAPAAVVPSLLPEEGQEIVTVGGDVPETLVDQDGIEITRRAFIRFEKRGDHLDVNAIIVPESIRERLDADEPFEVRYLTATPLPRLHRGLLLSLIAASTLSGSLAQSLAGERSERTLVSLRAAAVTAGEIVVGKWMAWGGFVSGMALLASLAAVFWRHLSAGVWLLAVPFPPLFAAALGLFLLRRARDVVGGAAVVIRGMPVILGAAGFASWLWLGGAPLWSAALPAGGAMMVAGGVIHQPGLVALSLASSALPTGVMLVLVARDLDPPPREEARGWLGALAEGTMAGVLWLSCLAAPGVFTFAGASAQAARMTPNHGVIAATLCLLTVWVLGAIRRDAPRLTPLVPVPVQMAVAALAAVGLAAGGSAALSAAPLPPAFDAFRAMLHAGLGQGLPLWLSALAIVAQEGLIRGRLHAMGGPWLAVGFWVAFFHPFDLGLGLATGLLLAGLRMATGGWWAGALARLFALVVPISLLDGPSATALVGVLGAALVAWAVWTDRKRWT